MLTSTIEAEVAAFLAVHADEVDKKGVVAWSGHRHAGKRALQTRIGPDRGSERPRVRDHEHGRQERFASVSP